MAGDQLDPFDGYDKEIRELRAINVALTERLISTNVTIADYLSGLWDGNEEGWDAVIDANREAIHLSIHGGASA